jgi:hypothetical protein
MGQTFPEQGPDEQAISEAALNRIVGTAETFDLEVIIEVSPTVWCLDCPQRHTANAMGPGK